MERHFFIREPIIAIFLSVVLFGCDSAKEEIAPEQLPPVPEACIALSDEYTRALLVAYTSAEVSQLQITRLAGEFDKCMRDAGLSKAEAKGIVKNTEKTAREKVDKGSGQDGFFYR